MSGPTEPYSYTFSDAENIECRGEELRFNLCPRGKYFIPMEYQPWMLYNEGIGARNIYNTPVSLSHFTIALVLSGHSYVDELVKMPCSADLDIIHSRFSSLADSQVLSGLWALDLGCGRLPMMARAMRALGATVYTVDVEPESSFWVDEDSIDNSFAQLERQNHIVLDYYDPAAAETILSVTKGKKFDYICAAMGYDMIGINGVCPPPKELASTLLKPGGVYVNNRKVSINPRTQSFRAAPHPIADRTSRCEL